MGLGHKGGSEFHILPLAGEMVMRHPVTLYFCAPISQLIIMKIELWGFFEGVSFGENYLTIPHYYDTGKI